MIRDRNQKATREVKAPNGMVMTVSASVASGLVGGSERWEYVDDGAGYGKGGTVKGDSMSGEKGKKSKEPAGVVGTSDKTAVTPSEPAEDPTQDPDADQGDNIEVPGGNAGKEAWVEYAVARGYDESDLERMPRNEIRALFADDQE